MQTLEILPATALRSQRAYGTRGPVLRKSVAPEHQWVLEAEAHGLEALRTAGGLCVPQVSAFGPLDGRVVLEIEWIERGAGGARTDALLGRGLAAQHSRMARRFGWERVGTIGRTTQLNGWSDDWAGFFGDARLGPQIELLRRGGEGAALGDAPERLLAVLPALLAGHRPQPSLLHGDLWGGNWLPRGDCVPVVLDPAVYYGDREADLAMTRLFGGFGHHFYESYLAAWPLPPGHSVRSALYNLYHVLNHANLFGGAYLGQAASVIASLLAETRG